MKKLLGVFSVVVCAIGAIGCGAHGGGDGNTAISSGEPEGGPEVFTETNDGSTVEIVKPGNLDINVSLTDPSYVSDNEKLFCALNGNGSGSSIQEATKNADGTTTLKSTDLKGDNRAPCVRYNPKYRLFEMVYVQRIKTVSGVWVHTMRWATAPDCRTWKDNGPLYTQGSNLRSPSMVINGSDRKIFYLANDANGASRIYCSIFVDHQYAGSKEVAIEGNAKSISVIQDGSLLRMFWTESGKLYSSTSGDGVNFTSKSLVGAYEMTSFEVTRTKEAEYALRYSKTDGSSIVRAMIARK